MDPLPLGLILIVVVACVMVATRPVQPRRRPTRTPSRPRRNPAADAKPDPSRRAAARITLSRNRWDRTDLSRAIGRDFTDPDGTSQGVSEPYAA